MIYEFDKEVPVPTSVERVGVNIELLRAMSPGDSKWWSEEDSKKAARFYRVAKKLGIKVIIRKVTKADPRGPGVRMWRQEGGPPPVVSTDPIAAAAEAAARAATPKRKLPTPKPVRKGAGGAVAKPKAKAKGIPVGNSGLEPAPHKVPRKPRPSEAKRKAAQA